MIKFDYLASFKYFQQASSLISISKIKKSTPKIKNHPLPNPFFPTPSYFPTINLPILPLDNPNHKFKTFLHTDGNKNLIIRRKLLYVPIGNILIHTVDNISLTIGKRERTIEFIGEELEEGAIVAH